MGDTSPRGHTQIRPRQADVVHPFSIRVYARGYADQVKARPDLYHWFPFDISTLETILVMVSYSYVATLR